MSKKKIVHLLRSNQFSGAENVVCQIANLFKNEESYGMLYCSPDGPIRKAVTERGVAFYPLESFSVRAVRKMIDELQPQIIHAHDAAACVLATLATLGRKDIKIIPHIHGNHPNMRHLSLKSLLFIWLSRRWKDIIWVSQSALDNYAFSALVKEKSIVLPNIITLPEEVIEENETSDKTFDCLVLGRLSPPKNPLRALKVFKEVIQTYPHLKVAFVGDGELREDCLQFVKKEQLEENIQFLGFIENPMTIVEASRLLVMTSAWEGTPM
ncbi:glycosyltransferase, partial [Streptococcus oralis]|uniref:glycosyltransferase n=1 Tax=Streptococcus oralis TaxID=1303 RepID=UPI0013E94A15